MKKICYASIILLLLCQGITIGQPASGNPSFFGEQISLVPAGAWTPVATGGRTICADGSDYRFFVRKGRGDKVVIFFQGGGVCWDDPSCLSPFAEGGRSFYTEKVPDSFQDSDGIFDFENEENPFREWTFVFIPYCSGDLHLAEVDTEYRLDNGPERTIYHRGATNVTSVLNWSGTQLLDPGQLVVMGASAGGYGAIFWSGTIAERFPEAEIFQLSDCSVSASDLFTESLEERWNAKILRSLKVDLSGTLLADGFRAVSSAHRTIHLAQINTVYDKILIYYQSALQGRQVDAGLRQNWSDHLVGISTALEDDLPDFTYFNTDYGLDKNGFTPHTLTGNDLFYQVEENGLRLLDWINNWLKHGDIPEVKVE